MTRFILAGRHAEGLDARPPKQKGPLRSLPPEFTLDLDGGTPHPRNQCLVWADKELQPRTEKRGVGETV